MINIIQGHIDPVYDAVENNTLDVVDKNGIKYNLYNEKNCYLVELTDVINCVSHNYDINEASFLDEYGSFADTTNPNVMQKRLDKLINEIIEKEKYYLNKNTYISTYHIEPGGDGAIELTDCHAIMPLNITIKTTPITIKELLDKVVLKLAFYKDEFNIKICMYEENEREKEIEQKAIEKVNDFIYKINDSGKFKLLNDCNSIDEFFTIDANEPIYILKYF